MFLQNSNAETIPVPQQKQTENIYASFQGFFLGFPMITRSKSHLPQSVDEKELVGRNNSDMFCQIACQQHLFLH